MKLSRLIHVSLTQRFDRNGKLCSSGGVELFAYLLRRVFPDMIITSWAASGLRSDAPDDEKAFMLNRHLYGIGVIGPESIVIGDGFWVNGLAGEVARCISVCHGSYFGTALEHEKYPWDEPLLGEWALKQEAVWKQPGVEIVSTSRRAAFELESICGLKSEVIPCGIPLDIFKPAEGGKGILHVAVSPRKGKEMVDKLNGQFEMQQLGYAPSGKLEDEAALWQRGSIFFMPSLYEGCANALMEALACGLVPVCYATGMAYDLPCWVAEVTDDHHETNYSHLLKLAQDNLTQYFPRQWAEEHLRFDIWAENWRRYLNG